MSKQVKATQYILSKVVEIFYYGTIVAFNSDK